LFFRTLESKVKNLKYTSSSCIYRCRTLFHLLTWPDKSTRDYISWWCFLENLD